mgnify:CR=1 FL=1
MRSVELFAGGGGLLIGSHMAGFRAEVAAEWDRWACDTLRENQAMAQASGEARSQEEIKQEAVAKLINERDDKIAALSAQLYALEQDRTAARKAQDELGAALAARATAEIALSFTEEEIALLQKKIQDLQLRLEGASKPDITRP